MNQRRILTVALVALAVYFAWSRGGSLFGARGALTGSDGSAGQRLIVDADVERLRIAALNRKTDTFSPGRNLFRFGAPKARQQVKPPPAPKPPPKPQPQVAQAAPEPTKPPAPRPPKIDFTYMGSFGPDGRKIAVFTDQGEKIVYVAAADSTAERRLVEIGFEDDNNAEIISGIETGETIVVKGQRSLKHGAVIKILDGSSTPAAAEQAGGQ